MTKDALISEIEMHAHEPEVYWPLIVAWVGEWITQKSKENSRQVPWVLYEQWVKEMGGS